MRLHRAGTYFSLISLLAAAAPGFAQNVSNGAPAPDSAFPRAAMPDKAQAGAGAPDIVGGTPAGPGDNPFQVGLLRKRSPNNFKAQFCGGSLIAPTIVVTAAHCGYFTPTGGRITARAPDHVQVLVGTRSLLKGGDRLDVASITPHPKYNPKNSNDYDVAVWRLASPADGIPLASLPTGDGVPGNMLLVTGWGRTSTAGQKSSTLLKVSVPIVSNETCSEAMGTAITPRMLCAGFSNGGRDACQGDSGGPATRGKGNMMLTGVVSWGFDCAQSDEYGVYVRVFDPSIMDFIEGELTKSAPLSRRPKAK